MIRKPYILKEEEIETLVQGIFEHGDQETYNRMRDKSMAAMQNTDNMDEMLMDMYDTMLERSRNASEDSKEEKGLKYIYYQVTSIFRILAHEIQREYIKAGKKKDSERFLRLVSNNKDAPVVS